MEYGLISFMRPFACLALHVLGAIVLLRYQTRESIRAKVRLMI